MSLMDDLKWAWSILADPAKNIKANSAGGAMAAYYRVSIIPVIVAIIVGVVVVATASSGIHGLGVVISPTTLVVSMIVGLAVLAWVALPIGLIIAAALFQLFAKLITKRVNGEYSKTLMSLVYGVFPTLIFFWLYPIPYVGELFMGLLGTYGVVITFTALSKLHNAPLGRVFTGYLVTVVVLLIIAFGLLYAILGSYLSILTGMLSGGGLGSLGSLGSLGTGHTTGGLGGYGTVP